MWHEALEEASRLYFTDHNPDGMIAHLEPYHEMLEKVVHFTLEVLADCSWSSSGSKDSA